MPGIAARRWPTPQAAGRRRRSLCLCVGFCQRSRSGKSKPISPSIDGELQKLVKGDTAIIDKSGTRNEFMKSLGRKLDTTVTNFNAFRGDPQLKQIRTDLAERAEKTQFVDTTGQDLYLP